jgi:Tfp pilus assembly protein PilO
MAEKQESKKEEKAKERSSLILFISLAIVVFAALGYFFVWPEYEKITDLTNKAEEQNLVLENENNTLASVKKLIANYNGISQNDREKIASILPETVDEPGLFVLFETLALKNKMALLAFDISEKEASADLKNLGIKEIDISVNLTGGEYGDFKNLLGDLESNLRLMDIVAINYTPDPSSLALNIKTYRLDTLPGKK